MIADSDQSAAVLLKERLDAAERERDSLQAQLDLAQKFHDVAVKERDYLRVRLARLEREETAK